MERQPRTMILSDGGLAALVASAIVRESATPDDAPGQPSPRSRSLAPMILPLACGAEGTRERELRLRAVSLQAEAYALDVPSPAVLPSFSRAGASPGEVETHELLAAVYVAATHGCESLIWPVQCAAPGSEGLDLDWIARSVDRGVLVGRLAALDAPEHAMPGIRVDVPYADFTDRQVADLAAEMGVPMKACWWHGVLESVSKPGYEENLRWTRALTAVGWREPAAPGVG